MISLDAPALENWLAKNGEKPYRVKQIWQGVFRDLAPDWDGITTLSKDLRAKLRHEVDFPLLPTTRENSSSDGQVKKALLELADGAQIETVLLDHHGRRTTVCISSMTGCPLGCKFCATGMRLGAGRNLTVNEIVAQVLHWNHFLKPQNREVTNVVLMGMGEPFLNYDNVIGSLGLLRHQHAGTIAQRRLTVSTAGVVPGIEKFAQDGGQVCLAVSLHAPVQELRAEIMPVAQRWPLPELMRSLDQYVAKTNRRVFYEYIMLKGVNDSLECAEQLADLLYGKLAHVNLIRYNDAAGDFASSAVRQVTDFQKILEQNGVPSTVRASLGDDIDAACGQLAGKS